MESIDAPLRHSEQAQSSVLNPGRLIRKPSSRLLLLLLLLVLLVIIQANSALTLNALVDRFQTFVTIFLGIFLEAASFLLIGSIVSGFIGVYLDQQLLDRFIPRQPILAALTGASLGLAFPVCECGVVPVTRRLYQKGMPQATGIAFLLAAPVINPIVIVSTYAAFGWGPMFWGRLGFSFLIAAVIGLIFTRAKPEEMLLPETMTKPYSPHTHHDCCQPDPQSKPISRGQRFWRAVAAGGDDFLDTSLYLVAGSILAAGMQTLVPQSTLLALGAGSLTSVVVMMLLAFVLSVCSTVDAFLALAFVNTFTPASILAFLVFGPMVDIKSSLMFLSVFRRRTVLYLILLPMMMTLLVAVYLNLNVRW